MSGLSALYRAALGTDDRADWHRLWQAVAGTALVLPLDGPAEDSLSPVVVETADGVAVRAFESLDAFAAAIRTPTDQAEIAGAELARMMQGQGAGISVELEDGTPLLVPAETVDWIAATWGAEVAHSERAGVNVTDPGLPDPEVIQALGEGVGALGADCPEAWLVAMTEPGGAPELVLVLGLADSARKAEQAIAEALTRSIQALTDQPFAVACPDRGSALMATARKVGIGIGG